MTVSLTLVRRLALVSLLANVGLVLTGGAVRLTGSGLGCPTWPQCTDESWTTTAEMGMHGVVEFGNRTLTFVLGGLALAGLAAVWRLRPRPSGLAGPALGVLVGVGAQGLIGGITVRTGLNPWIVGAHFLVSIGIIAMAYAFWRRARPATASPATTVPRALRGLAGLLLGVTFALLAVGTVVTGSGPHAGDPDVARNGLDPQALSQVHAQLAYLLLGMAIAAWFGSRAAAVPAAAGSAAILVAAICGQAAVGMVQHFTGLPELLVWLHLLGSCLVWLAALKLWYATAPAPAPTAPSPADAGFRHSDGGSPWPPAPVKGSVAAS